MTSDSAIFKLSISGERTSLIFNKKLGTTPTAFYDLKLLLDFARTYRTARNQDASLQFMTNSRGDHIVKVNLSKMSTFKFDEKKAAAFLSESDSTVKTSYKHSTSGNPAATEEFRNELKTTLYNDLGSVDIHFYGSRFIGVSAPESDLDIFVDVGGKFDSSYEFTSEDEENFEKIENALKKSSDWKYEVAILGTLVPIVKAVYLPWKINCE